MLNLEHELLSSTDCPVCNEPIGTPLLLLGRCPSCDSKSSPQMREKTLQRLVRPYERARSV